MPRLNQIIAIEKGIKNKTQAEITAAHHAVQKTELISGISRVYQPKDDDGDRFPAEKKLVQVKAIDAFAKAAADLGALFDITLTKDSANQSARATVTVDGKNIAEDVPVTYLIFLEKQLADVLTFVKKLPVLDPSEEWHYDETTGTFATTPAETVKTKKVLRNHVKAKATDHHPEQVDVYNEDVVVGTWKTIKYSGAVPQTRVDQLVQRVEKLQRAVKFAREEANTLEVKPRTIGDSVFAYITAA